MLPDWISHLSTSFTGDSIETLHATTAAAELTAARDATIIAPLVHLSPIRFAGEETITFLQNQLSSDVKIVGNGLAQYSSYSTPKGRMLASFLIYPETDGAVLLASADIRDAIQKRLSMFIMRSKVKANAPEIALFGLAGPASESLLTSTFGSAPTTDYGVTTHEHGSIIKVPNLGFIITVVAEQVASVWKTLSAGAQPVGPQAWMWREIQAGIVRISAATQELFVPQMANFDRVGAVSFTKGCYPGQEIVARTQYLGKLKKRTYLASVMSDAPVNSGEAVYSKDLGDQATGHIANVAPNAEGGFDVLVVLHTSSLEHGVTLGSPEGHPLIFRPLPYEVL